MPLAVEKEIILDSIITSYEARIESVESFFCTAGQIFHDFQDFLFSTRTERETINTQLRETLAQRVSLRKKDFDRMTAIISSYLDESENEIRQLSHKYLNEQTALVQQLRESLRNFKDALTHGRSEKVNELHKLIQEIIVKQENNKTEVTSRLNDFRKGQQYTSKMFKELLAKGDNLRIKDFKTMLNQFKKQRRHRLAYQFKRREEVRDMLDKFKADRIQTERVRLGEHKPAMAGK